jgi:rubrerythrin
LTESSTDFGSFAQWRERRRAAMRRAVAPLVRDMRRALRSELGAYSLYSLLPRVTRGAELRRLLDELRREEAGIVAEVRDLMASLGGRPERSRWTRSVAAWCLTVLAPVTGVRFALRLCHESESTVSRWYAEYAAFFASVGDRERAVAFHELSTRKRLHATRLAAFVTNLRTEPDDLDDADDDRP